MSDMIERVALAIGRRDNTQIDDSETGQMFWEKYRDHYRNCARDAIEAMRPYLTEEAIRALGEGA